MATIRMSRTLTGCWTVAATTPPTTFWNVVAYVPAGTLAVGGSPAAISAAVLCTTVGDPTGGGLDQV